mgnify:CR=1 FL=1
MPLDDPEGYYDEIDPEQYAQELLHELRVRGIPKMDLRINIHNDGDLEVGIYNCSMTDFTAENYYPNGLDYPIREIAEDLVRIFLDYVEWDDQPKRNVKNNGFSDSGKEESS